MHDLRKKWLKKKMLEMHKPNASADLNQLREEMTTEAKRFAKLLKNWDDKSIDRFFRLWRKLEEGIGIVEIAREEYEPLHAKQFRTEAEKDQLEILEHKYWQQMVRLDRIINDLQILILTQPDDKQVAGDSNENGSPPKTMNFL